MDMNQLIEDFKDEDQIRYGSTLFESEELSL